MEGGNKEQKSVIPGTGLPYLPHLVSAEIYLSTVPLENRKATHLTVLLTAEKHPSHSA